MLGENRKKETEVIVDLKLYPLEVIYGASYVFIEKAYVFMKSIGKDKVSVRLRSKGEVDPCFFDEIMGEFENELLHQSLRLSLEKNNKVIRQRIIERALYGSIGNDEDIWNE